MKNNNTEKKNWLLIAAIHVVLFILVNLVVIILPVEHVNIFWVSYVFMFLAFLVEIGSLILAFRNFEKEIVFFGLPLAMMAMGYFVIALLAGVICMAVQVLPLLAVLMLHVLILGIYAILALLAILTNNTVKATENNLRESVLSIKMLVSDMDICMARAADMQVRNELKNLKEVIQYSDPMSNDAVYEIEQQIMKGISALKYHIQRNENEEAIHMCIYTEELFLERNRVLLATK